MDPNNPTNLNNQNPQPAPQPTPAPEPAPTVAPQPTPAPEPSPAPQPAATPAQPQPQPTPTPAPQELKEPKKPKKSKKLSPAIIGLIIVLVLILGGGVIGGLILTGVIPLGDGSSGKGLFGKNYSVPTDEQIESVCSKYNGTSSTFNTADEEIPGFGTIHEYSCAAQSSSGFIVMALDQDILDALPEIQAAIQDNEYLSDETSQIKLNPGRVGSYAEDVFNMIFVMPSASSASSDDFSVNFSVIEDTPDYYRSTAQIHGKEAAIAAYKNVLICAVFDDSETSNNILTDLGAI